MMDRDKILTKFGWNVLRALDTWKRNGYTVADHFGSLILTADKTEIRIERWSTHIYVRMTEPVAFTKGTWAHLMVPDGECLASRKVVEFVSECMDHAERERYRLTPTQRASFSREWQELFTDLEGQGYTVEWRTYERSQGGVLAILGHGSEMGISLNRGQWMISSGFNHPTEGYRDVKFRMFDQCDEARCYIAIRLFLLKGHLIKSNGGGAA